MPDALRSRAHKRRLADEYDAAQERGEVATGRDGPGAGVLDGNAKATAAEIGLSRKDVHEARAIRDAEKADPGVVERTLEKRLATGQEPTKAALRGAVQKVRDETRAGLSPEIHALEAAKQKAIADRKAKPANVEALTAEIEELREANAALETELAEVKADNAKWEAMRVQFEQGGFAEVIAGKDEEIRALLSRVERESQEKVKNLRAMEFWKKEALKLGYSRDAVIDIETGEIING